MKLRSSKLVESIVSSTRRAVQESSVPSSLNLRPSETRVTQNCSQDEDDISDLGSPLTSFPSSPEYVQKTLKKRSVRVKNESVKVEEIEETLVKNEVLESHEFNSKITKISKKRVSGTIKKEDGSQDNKPKVQRKSPNKGSKKAKEFIPISPPSNWEETFLRIQEYRKTHLAPVDSMGCERADVPDLSPKEFRFHVLIALMLSSQTKDEETYAAMAKLRKAGDGKLTAEILDVMDEDTLHDCIRQVGFHNMKTKFVKKAARICIEEYNGDIPSTIKDLMLLPGVGPKMSFLAMQCGWDVNVGIGVDTHVHRISNRLGWVKTNAPEETRVSLESWLPEKWWKAINFLLVGLGQTICYGNKPRCYACPVADLCPSRDSNSIAPAAGKPLPRVRSAEPKILLEIESKESVSFVTRSRHFPLKDESPETKTLYSDED